MKDGMRFVDCDMHIMEPQSLFDRYLDPKFKSRVTSMVAADGSARANWYIDGVHPSEDTELSQYRKPIRPNNADASILSPSLGNLTSSRLVETGRMDFALESEVQRGSAGHGDGDGGDRHRGPVPDLGAEPDCQGRPGPVAVSGACVRPTITGFTNSASTAPTS